MNKFRLYTSEASWATWYERFQYPGGELQVRLTPEFVSSTPSVINPLIVARLYSPVDIMELLLLCDAMQAKFHKRAKVIIPYKPYARADRRFVDGDCLGEEVFMTLIQQSRGIESAHFLDPHSGAISEEIEFGGTMDYIKSSIAHFSETCCGSGRVTVLLPDAGAARRYGDRLIAPSSNIEEISIDVFNCTKQRDPKTGKLSGFTVPALPEDQPILIVDDICDGGGTFIGIADTAKRFGPIALHTTHGIYSNGTDILYRSGFEYLYTTNSYYRFDPLTSPQRMIVYDCIPAMLRDARMKNF